MNPTNLLYEVRVRTYCYYFLEGLKNEEGMNERKHNNILSKKKELKEDNNYIIIYNFDYFTA